MIVSSAWITSRIPPSQDAQVTGLTVFSIRALRCRSPAGASWSAAVIPGCNPRVSGGFHVNQRIYTFRRVASLAVMAPIAKTLLKNHINGAYDRFGPVFKNK
jgi:hypothetical protein